MNRSLYLGIVLLTLLFSSKAGATGPRGARKLNTVNANLAGQVVDYTDNHGCDRRLWSEALKEPRSMYVYLPPGFDPEQRYPVVLWLHGLGQDEKSFFEMGFPMLDEAIRNGKLPPVIVATPNGNVTGKRNLILPTHSGFLNTQAGNFEDYLNCDVWKFLVENFPIRPERAAHVVGGVSLGGGGAYHLAIKHRQRYGVVFGVYPPLNLRWVDCHGRYFSDFDPGCWGWRTSVTHGGEVEGRFYGVITIPVRRLVYPLYGRKTPETIEQLSRDNPIEMLEAHDVRPGELSMFVAYGGKDQFNIDAQVESFLYRARQRCLKIKVVYDPQGRHTVRTALKFAPALVCWLNEQLTPFAPPCAEAVGPVLPLRWLRQGQSVRLLGNPLSP